MIKKLIIIIHNELRLIYGQLLSLKKFKDFVNVHLFLINIYFKRIINFKNYKKNLIFNNDIKFKKKSNILFIFGCGSSLNKLSKKEITKLNNYDTIGFNLSFLFNKIYFTFHINRSGTTRKSAFFSVKKFCKYFNKKIKKNKFLKKTIFLFPIGYVNGFTNTLFGYNLFSNSHKFFLFITNRINKLPSKSFDTGLAHSWGSLADAINFGYIMNYKKIVLVGIDLYDNRYFFCPKNKTKFWDEKNGKFVCKTYTDKGLKYSKSHNTINIGVLSKIQKWNTYLKKNNIQLEVYNKKSLLKKHLKIFNWNSLRKGV